LDVAKAFLSFFVWLAPLVVLANRVEAHFFTQFVSDYLCGFIVASALLSSSYVKAAYNSLYHPLIRITDQYLIMHFDRVIYPWNDIKKVQITRTSIEVTTKKKKLLWNTDSESIKFVPNRKELVKTLVKHCEKISIPCGSQKLIDYDF